MDETREIEIDLRKIIYMMRTKVIYILLITILGGCVVTAFTHFFVTPTYTATVKFYASSNTDVVSTNSSITYAELDAAQKMTNLCVYIIKSDTLLNKVAEDVQLGGAEDIRDMISASSVDEIQAFTVTVKNKDKAMAAKIANSVATIAPTEILRIIKGGNVEVIDYATEPQKPSSPNIKKNAAVGALAGFILSFAAFFVYEIFDSSITNAKDLERDFDIPVLGTIPRLESVRPVTAVSADRGSLSPPEQSISAKPSQSLLDSIQSVKGESANEQKK